MDGVDLNGKANKSTPTGAIVSTLVRWQTAVIWTSRPNTGPSFPLSLSHSRSAVVLAHYSLNLFLPPFPALLLHSTLWCWAKRFSRLMYSGTEIAAISCHSAPWDSTSALHTHTQRHTQHSSPLFHTQIENSGKACARVSVAATAFTKQKKSECRKEKLKKKKTKDSRVKWLRQAKVNTNWNKHRQTDNEWQTGQETAFAWQDCVKSARLTKEWNARLNCWMTICFWGKKNVFRLSIDLPFFIIMSAAQTLLSLARSKQTGHLSFCFECHTLGRSIDELKCQ